MCNACACSEAVRRNKNHRLAENCCPIFQGALASPEHFSAEFAVLLIMSWLKADKLIHQASDSWHFMIWSTGRLRGKSRLFKAPDEQNTAQILSCLKKKYRLWNVLMKMSHVLLSLLISSLKLISKPRPDLTLAFCIQSSRWLWLLSRWRFDLFSILIKVRSLSGNGSGRGSAEFSFAQQKQQHERTATVHSIIKTTIQTNIRTLH